MTDLINDMGLGGSQNQTVKTVLLATDHAGFELKEKIKAYLREKGVPLEDLGAFVLEPEDDYPDYMHMAGKRVGAESERYSAIIVGGSGQGEAIVANRYKGVRAVVYNGGNLELVKVTREHNDANILSLGARFISEAEALQAVDLFLTTVFSGDERHVRRIDKIDNTKKDSYTF